MADGGCIDDGRRREQPELLRRRTFAGADFPYLAANVKYAGTEQDDPAGLHGQEHQGRQDRLHRHDPQGHADHRHRVRGRRAGVHRRGRRPPTRSCPCCEAQGVKAIVVLIHQGGVPATARTAHLSRLDVQATTPPADGDQRQGSSCRPARSSRSPSSLDPADRHGRLGPHPPAVRVLASRTRPGKPRLVTSASSFGRLVHGDDADVRPSHARTSCAARSTGSNMHRRPATSPRTRRRPQLIPQLQDAHRADRQQGDRARSAATSRRHQRRRRVPARRPHRRRPARRPVGRRWPAAGRSRS